MVCNVSRALLLLCYINIYDKYIIYIVDAPLMNFNGVRFGMAWFGLDPTPHCEILSKFPFHFSQAIL